MATKGILVTDANVSPADAGGSKDGDVVAAYLSRASIDSLEASMVALGQNEGVTIASALELLRILTEQVQAGDTIVLVSADGRREQQLDLPLVG